jgi:hypothetical protein
MLVFFSLGWGGMRGGILAFTRDGESLILDIMANDEMMYLMATTPWGKLLLKFPLFSPSCFGKINEEVIAFAVKHVLYDILNIEERREMPFSVYSKVMERIEDVAKARASKQPQ